MPSSMQNAPELYTERQPGQARPNHPELSLTGDDPKASLAAIRDINERSRRETGGDLEKKTRIRGTGAARDTEVTIKYDGEGKPNFIRDHLGEWQSKDGGNTWTTGKPQFRVRRGHASIDGEGNYSFENTDYGVRQTFRPDGSSTREMTAGSGEKYSLTKDAKGTPTGFSDESGRWKGDGKTWKNEETGQTRKGTVTLTDFGEFRFKPENGEEQTRRTEQNAKINQLQDELCSKYGVIFAKPGERRKEDDGVRLVNGVPTEAELNTLKDVLDKTRHENYKGTKVWFIRPDENGETNYAHYVNTNERPNEGNEKREEGHRCHGNCAHTKGLVRSSNGDMVVLPKARQVVKGNDGLEGTLLHELGHHEQGQRTKPTDVWGGRDSTPESRELAKNLGWTWSERHQANLLKDKDGGKWLFNEDKDNWRWVGGTPPKDKRHRLNNEQMAKKAAVTPASNYFDYPYEHHAEALAMYRIGVGEHADGKDRGHLAHKSPVLYKQIKEFDQQSIDRTFGTVNGASRYIRSLTGHLVENTPAARRAVQEQETMWFMAHML